jgi:hypothetical protein
MASRFSILVRKSLACLGRCRDLTSEQSDCPVDSRADITLLLPDSYSYPLIHFILLLYYPLTVIRYLRPYRKSHEFPIVR